MTLRLRTLLPMAADGVGPSLTCSRLVDGAWRAGADIDFWVNRARKGGTQSARMHSVLPGPLASLPYKPLAGPASNLLESLYLKSLREGDIAWLWPSVSLKLHETIRARGLPILLEGINTRMAAAKEVLDIAYDAIGVAPGHGITEERIREEEAKLALATSIFAPSPDVEAALAGSALEGRFIASSYGVDTTNPPPLRGPRHKGPVVFLFVGYACVRKGIHHLLDLWSEMPPTATLRLVGRIEPLIAERYADLLASDRVETVGFTRDVASQYKAADVFVFPSLEEGDPLVTYEAALHGLPIVVSPAGAGRIGADCPEAMTVVAPGDSLALFSALEALHASPELREHQGQAARAAVMHYDWDKVGARRVEALKAMFEAAPVTASVPARPLAPAPTVSVVLPAYNREGSIRASIESVLRQTWSEFELIVVDDCSSDNTREAVRAIPDSRLRLVENPRNLGPSGARNTGIAEARGDWIAFQDSDDEWLPQKLARQVERLRQPGPEWVAVYCGMGIEGNVFKVKGARTQVRYIPDPEITLVEGDIRTSLLVKSLVSTQTLMVRRSALEQVGGFDVSLPALEDWDLTLRLAQAGPFAFVDEMLVIQRFSPNSITRDRSKWITARVQILDKHKAALSSMPRQLSRQYQILAGQYRQIGQFDQAREAIGKARAITPNNPSLVLRGAYLRLNGLIRHSQ